MHFYVFACPSGPESGPEHCPSGPESGPGVVLKVVLNISNVQEHCQDHCRRDTFETIFVWWVFAMFWLVLGNHNDFFKLSLRFEELSARAFQKHILLCTFDFYVHSYDRNMCVAKNKNCNKFCKFPKSAKFAKLCCTFLQKSARGMARPQVPMTCAEGPSVRPVGGGAHPRIRDFSALMLKDSFRIRDFSALSNFE